MEEVVLKQVEKLLSGDSFAHEIYQKAQKMHQNNTVSQEIKRHKLKVSGYNSNLDALAERLAELPKSVTAAPIYRQMEKLEDARQEA